MTDTQQLQQDAAKQWAHFPYRRCWIAVKDDETAVILKPTAHCAAKMAREGWQVWELKRA